MILRILRNVISLLTGQVVAKLLSLGCVIFLARRLGVEGFGTYGTVMAYLTLFAAFAESGLNTVTIREVSQDYTQSNSYFWHVLILRGLLTLLSFGCMIFLGGIWKADEFPLIFIISCGLFLFPEAIRKLGISMLSAYERMDVVAVLDVVAIVFRYLPFLIAVFFGASLHVAFLLLVGSWMCVAAIWIVITRKYCAIQRVSAVRLQQLWDIFYESLPFGVVFILSIIYFKADIIMLANIQGKAAVGLYEGAYKFIEAAMFIPTSIVSVLLPVMSRSFVADKDTYSKLYVHSTRILAIGILPVVIFVSFFAKNIILLVYGEAYLPSASALSLLIWTLFFIFLNAPVGNIVATSKLMHAFLPYAIGNTLLNIVLNALLIPQYSFLGASFTTVFTECTGFVIQLWFASRVLQDASDVLRIFGKLFVTAMITCSLFYPLRSLLVFPLNGILLLMIYGGCLFVLRLISPEDKKWCGELIKMAKAKIPLSKNRV